VLTEKHTRSSAVARYGRPYSRVWRPANV